MPVRDAIHDADRHMAEYEDHLHQYDHEPRHRMSGGEVFTAAIIIGAAAYFSYHFLRFLIANNYLGF